MISGVVAGVLTTVLTLLHLEVSVTSYWKRWLGGWYFPSRVLLALIPAAVGVLASIALRPATTIENPWVLGAVAGVLGAAVLRADGGTRRLELGHSTASTTSRQKIVLPGEPSTTSTQVTTILIWYYQQGQRTLDAIAGRAITKDIQRQKAAALKSLARVCGTTELVANAEELASVMAQMGRRLEVKSRVAAAMATMNLLHQNLDILLDQLAADDQRRRAAHALGEVLGDEYRIQRWERPASRKKGKAV
jgi:hypothetical protein